MNMTRTAYRETAELHGVRLRPIVLRLEGAMQCNCDLDKWQPEPSTGHSFVCRIHNAAIQQAKDTHEGKR